MSRVWPTLTGLAPTPQRFSIPTHLDTARAAARVEQRAPRRPARARRRHAARRDARAAARRRSDGAGWLRPIARSGPAGVVHRPRDRRRDEPARRCRSSRCRRSAARRIVLAGSPAQRDRWLPGIIEGRVDGGVRDDRARRRLRRRGAATTARAATATDWVIDGEKHLISNAGLADVYVVFARTSPGAGSRGISAFVVPADTPGLSFAGAQVLAAPHPLGRAALRRLPRAGATRCSASSIAASSWA